MFHLQKFLWLTPLSIVISSASFSEPGFIKASDGQALFPIGFYELPAEDAALKAMADAGVNLVRCSNKAALDRAHAEGMYGWLPLPMQQGVTESLRKQVTTLKDHPALAVWEGPDEVVWNFTAWSGLHWSKGIHEKRGDWFRQTPAAVAYSKEQAKTVIPSLLDSIAYIREQDDQQRPIWFNEANESDASYVRQYADVVDVIGCDLYPVNSKTRDVARMGESTDRWKLVGKGMPVWMVLQAFSWHELEEQDSTKPPAYASFKESRLMAYDVIAHGAQGILYWGSHYLRSEETRQSVYAVCSELAALQPFLTAPEIDTAQITLIEAPRVENQRGVAKIVREYDGEWLVVLINEDDHYHMGVELTGLEVLSGKELTQLYGNEIVSIEDAAFMTRLMPLEVKVFCTSNAFATDRLEGRDYTGTAPAPEKHDKQVKAEYP